MTESYPVPPETLPSLSLAHHLDDLIEMRDFLEGRGINTQNTRVGRYATYLEDVSTHGMRDASKIFKNSVGDRFQIPLDWLLYVLREVHELAWILKGLKINLPSGIDEKLQKVVSGRDFAALDSDSQSRDIQYELRIASYFCQAGCEVHLDQETDIIALTNEHAFYLECKRIGSDSQLQKRLAEARSQLTSRLPKKLDHREVYGCVAADVTKVAFPRNGFTFGVTNEHAKNIVQRKLVHVSDVIQRTPLFRDSKQLLFYWLQIHIPGLIEHPLTPTTRFSSMQVSRPGLDRKERRAARVFYGVFEFSSDRRDAREIPAKKLKARREVTLPAGTRFGLNDRLLSQQLELAKLSENDLVETIGTLSFDGKDHDFSVGDFLRLPAEIVDEWKKSAATDLARTSLLVLLEMYLQRFPYEEVNRAPREASTD